MPQSQEGCEVYVNADPFDNERQHFLHFVKFGIQRLFSNMKKQA
jgi:hypothetical protein